MKSLTYLALQATREGQASFAHVHEIIKGLKKRGWQVILWEPSYAKEDKDPHVLRRFAEFVRVQLALWRSQSQGSNLDILYIRHHFAAWPTALWAKLRGILVVQEVNGPYEDLFVAWPWTRWMRPLFVYLMGSQLRWADAVITVTPQLAEWAQQQGARNVHVIPNGANTDLFSPSAPLPQGIQLPPRYVLFFGALAPWQGIGTMLAALKSPDWPQDTHLVIAGDGVERSRVEEAMQADPRIVYLGKVRYRDLPGIVAASKVALSVKESQEDNQLLGVFPLKVFEALACGVPVIVSDFPGMADLVRQYGCGLVIPPGDPKALARAVKYLVEHEDLRAQMGRKGREIVEREHSWDCRAEETDRFLRNLLKKTNRISLEGKGE